MPESLHRRATPRALQVSDGILELLRWLEKSPNPARPSTDRLDPLHQIDLARELYRLFHRRPFEPAPPTDRAAVDAHLASLAAANCGRGTWDPGWRIHRWDHEDDVAVEKDGLVHFVSRRDLRLRDSGGGKPRSGDRCRARVPEEQQRLLPGFYLALGDADLAEPEELDYELRLYWHLTAPVAAHWVELLTAQLNRGAVPFRLKALSDPRHYRRADSGVLYLEPAHYSEALETIEAVHRQVRRQLRPETPRLALRLAPGLALAEGPSDGSSFGEHRCGLIAEAVARAQRAGIDSLEGRARAVAEHLLEAGLDPLRPHLAPGSMSRYRALDQGAGSRAEPAGGPRAASDPAFPTPPQTADFTQAARRVGDHLCRTAVWVGGRCNWVGRSAGERSRRGGKIRPRVTALSTDLYQGSAGIGLFLAELFARTGDDDHRRTALAALERSCELVEQSPQLPSLAFYSGRLGVAVAAQRAASLLDMEQLTERAGRLLDECLAVGAPPEPLDLLGGHAGAVLALLGLYRETGESELLMTASRLGQDIFEAGIERSKRWTWPNARVSGIAPDVPQLSTTGPLLTGLSHGASGLGVALLELAAVTGREDFLAAGRGAFEYERSCFDRERGNWPDLRSQLSSESTEPRALHFLTAWCHGAPGISLARLRAIASDPERAPQYEQEARVALDTTAGALRTMVESPSDTSLCHGATGLIDVLLVGSQILGESSLSESAEEAMACLLRASPHPERWPSGVPSRGPNPSLFLGTAGAGYLLLRLEGRQRPPSPLIPFSEKETGLR